MPNCTLFPLFTTFPSFPLPFPLLPFLTFSPLAFPFPPLFNPFSTLFYPFLHLVPTLLPSHLSPLPFTLLSPCPSHFSTFVTFCTSLVSLFHPFSYFFTLFSFAPHSPLSLLCSLPLSPSPLVLPLFHTPFSPTLFTSPFSHPSFLLPLSHLFHSFSQPSSTLFPSLLPSFSTRVLPFPPFFNPFATLCLNRFPFFTLFHPSSTFSSFFNIFHLFQPFSPPCSPLSLYHSLFTPFLSLFLLFSFLLHFSLPCLPCFSLCRKRRWCRVLLGPALCISLVCTARTTQSGLIVRDPHSSNFRSCSEWFKRGGQNCNDDKDDVFAPADGWNTVLSGPCCACAAWSGCLFDQFFLRLWTPFTSIPGTVVTIWTSVFREDFGETVLTWCSLVAK